MLKVSEQVSVTPLVPALFPLGESVYLANPYRRESGVEVAKVKMP